MNELWPSLLLSMEIATAATLLVCFVGIPLAYVMSRARFFGKSVVEALIMLPLVLPPTVVGYLILSFLGVRSWLGAWLDATFDYQFAFRFEAAVLAAAVVALPMLYMPAKAGFQGVDREMEDIAKTMGANRLQMFWHVNLPLARRAIASGFVLAFARAIGEFGATMMVYGWHEDRLTMPILIYRVYEGGLPRSAALPVIVALISISIILLMAYNRWSRAEK